MARPPRPPKASESTAPYGDLKASVRRELVALLRDDPDLRAEVAGLLGVGALARAIEDLVAELRAARESADRRFEEQGKRIEELARSIEEQGKRIEEQGKRIEELARRIEEQGKRIEEQGRRIEMAFLRVDAMGARWGMQSEAAFREGLRKILSERFGASVERWEHDDAAGEVFGHPARVDLDVVVRDGEPLVVEVKAHVSAGDVALFQRRADLYDRVSAVRARRMIVSPSVDDRARELAATFGIEVASAF